MQPTIRAGCICDCLQSTSVVGMLRFGMTPAHEVGRAAYQPARGKSHNGDPRYVAALFAARCCAWARRFSTILTAITEPS